MALCILRILRPYISYGATRTDDDVDDEEANTGVQINPGFTRPSVKQTHPMLTLIEKLQETHYRVHNEGEVSTL